MRAIAFIAIGATWLTFGGAALGAAGDHGQAGSTFGERYPSQVLLFACFGVPGSIFVYLGNRWTGARLATATERLLAPIAETDILFESIDASLRLTSVGLGFAIQWMGADVVVTRDRLLILPYNRLLGFRACQPVIAVASRPPRLQSTRFIRALRIEGVPAALPDGGIQLVLSPDGGAWSRTATLTDLDQAAFLGSLHEAR